MMKSCFNTTLFIIRQPEAQSRKSVSWICFEIQENYMQEIREIHGNQPSPTISQAIAEDKLRYGCPSSRLLLQQPLNFSASNLK